MQLLQKLSITAVGKREKLLRVIKNPVTQYLPINSRRIGKIMLYEFSCGICFITRNDVYVFFNTGLSHSSDKLVNINQYVASAVSDTDIVFVVSL